MLRSLSLLSALLCTSLSFAQNVGINASGTAGHPSAMLDVESTEKGLLVPRMTEAQRNDIDAPAEGLLVYQNDGDSGFYFYNGGEWELILGRSQGWSLEGNAGTDPDINFVGTSDASDLVVRSNDVPWMRVLSGGGIAVNNNATFGPTLFNSFAIGTDDAVAGVAANGLGIIGSASGTDATGGAFRGNSAPLFVLNDGSGIIATGITTGVAGIASTTTSEGFGGYFENDQSFAVVGGWQFEPGPPGPGAWTSRKIVGNGTVNTIVKDQNGNSVTMTCPEAPDIVFQDFGVGQLENGEAVIVFDPTLSKNIVVNEEFPLKVFIQPEGMCNGLFVTEKTQNGFVVKELQNGQSNVGFSWMITAQRADEEIVLSNGEIRVSEYTKGRFAPAPQPLDKKELRRSMGDASDGEKPRAMQPSNR